MSDLVFLPLSDQDAGMVPVSSVELKSRFSTYLGMARAAATFDITSYRRSVARPVPAGEEELLVEDPTEPPEALSWLDRLQSGRFRIRGYRALDDRRWRVSAGVVSAMVTIQPGWPT